MSLDDPIENIDSGLIDLPELCWARQFAVLYPNAA